jgi:anti-sigma factor RsiW
MDIFSSHIGFERLVDLVEGRLPPAEQTSLLAHLNTCNRCAADKAWLERVINLMRTDTTENPPPGVIDRARRLFQARASSTSTQRRRIPALLQFDSRQQPLALGVRSGPAAVRQLLLKAEDYVLDVRVTPAGAAWQVSGQLLGPDANGQVELQGETTTVQIELNELGEFSLPPVPTGSYNFLLHLADLDLDLPTLYLGI